MTIYVITHKESGKSYVGQSVNVRKRIAEHIRSAGTSSSLIARAIEKYGVESFYVRYADLPVGSDRDLLNDIEQRVIAELGTIHPGGYNLASGGGVNHSHHPDTIEKLVKAKLGHEVSAETREKISAALRANHPMRGVPVSEESKEHLRRLFSGKPLSDEHRKKLRDSHAKRRAAGIKNKPWSDEARRKASEARKGYVMPQATKDKLRDALKGRSLSEETKKKMRAARAGHRPEWLWEANRGRPVSEETRNKIRLKKLERDAAARAAKAVSA